MLSPKSFRDIIPLNESGKYTNMKLETTEERINRSYTDSCYYSDLSSRSYLDPEPCDLRPKTDYTYAKTFIYREFPTLHKYISPNMSRRPLRGNVTMTPELKEYFRDMDGEDVDGVLGTSYTEERMVRENNSNNYLASHTSHTSQSKSNRRRRRNSDLSSTMSTASGTDENGMVLRSGSRLHGNNIEQIIEENNNRNTRGNSVDRKATTIMENNAIKHRLMSQNRNYNGWDGREYETRLGMYNQTGYTTVRKTLVEEFEETEYSNSMSRGNTMSSKNAMSSRLSNGYGNHKAANDKYKSTSTSVSHMYGLDSEEEYSDKETYDSYSEKDHLDGEIESPALNMVTTTVIRTVITTVETITSIMKPVITPVWNVTVRPLWYLLSPFVYALAKTLGWILTILFTLVAKVIVFDSWLLSRIRRNRGACLCLCLPLLLFFLLPFLMAGMREVLTQYEQSLFVPPVIPVKPVVTPAQPVVPIIKNTSVYNISMLTQEITRIMMLRQEEQGEQLSRADIELIVGGILKEELEAFRLTINENNINIAQEIRNIKTEDNSKVDALGVKLDDMIVKFEKLAAETQAAKEDIRLDVNQLNVTASRLRELEEELSALRASFSNLDLNFQALSMNLRNCCRNNSEDLAGIRTHVNQILTQMVSGYSNDDDSNAGFTAWLRDNFISQDHFQSQLKSLGEDLTLQMAAMARSNDQSSTPKVVVSGGNLTETHLRELIDRALWKFHADKTGLADYALESGGGSVISVRCSKTYFRKTSLFSVFGIPLWYISNSARTLIQPEMQPGECWPFEGKQGFVVIQLAAVITPTAFSLEHIPKSIAPSGKIDSAPSDFTVIGLDSEEDKVGVSLGNYTYSSEGSPLQYFPVQRQNPGPFKFIELRVLDNHGNKDYTCIYRFRVHGEPVLR